MGPHDEDGVGVIEEIVHRRGQFGHAQHLELAWTCLASAPFERAEEKVTAAIRHFSALHGAGERYHDTITRAWLRVVGIHASVSGATSFDEFIAANPALLDQSLLERHYTAGLLRSAEARTAWVDPDVRGFPAVAP